MKKLVFALMAFLYSFDLMGQIEGYTLKEKYDSIPTTELNHKFVSILNFKFDSLVNKGVDSIMLFYCAVPNLNFALFICKGIRCYSSIAVYEYIPNHTRLGSEILSSTILDSTNIFAFYSIFRNKEIRFLDSLTFIIHYPSPIYGKFYFGKSAKLYAGFEISVWERANNEFKNAYLKERDRIIDREYKIYERKNK